MTQGVQILSFEQFQWLVSFAVGGYAALGSAVVVLFWQLMVSRDRELRSHESLRTLTDKLLTLTNSLKYYLDKKIKDELDDPP